MMEIFWTMLAGQDRKRIREYMSTPRFLTVICHFHAR